MVQIIIHEQGKGISINEYLHMTCKEMTTRSVSPCLSSKRCMQEDIFMLISELVDKGQVVRCGINYYAKQNRQFIDIGR